jgi:hypothetical protein
MSVQPLRVQGAVRSVTDTIMISINDHMGGDSSAVANATIIVAFTDGGSINTQVTGTIQVMHHRSLPFPIIILLFL